jgi:hypothetical protein
LCSGVSAGPRADPRQPVALAKRIVTSVLNRQGKSGQIADVRAPSEHPKIRNHAPYQRRPGHPCDTPPSRCCATSSRAPRACKSSASCPTLTCPTARSAAPPAGRGDAPGSVHNSPGPAPPHATRPRRPPAARPARRTPRWAAAARRSPGTPVRLHPAEQSDSHSSIIRSDAV